MVGQSNNQNSHHGDSDDEFDDEEETKYSENTNGGLGKSFGMSKVRMTIGRGQQALHSGALAAIAD